MDKALSSSVLGLATLLLVGGAFLARPSGSMQTDDVSFVNAAGDRLRGCLYRPSAAASPGPGVILCHGAGCSKEILRVWAELCAEAGLVTLTVDFAGHGESQGSASGSNQEDDLQAARAWLCARPEVEADRLGLGGHSLGALPVVQVGQEADGVQATVALAMNVPAGPTFPPNLLLGVGAYDEVHPPYEMRAAWEQATSALAPSPTAASASGPTVADFRRGIARRLVISPRSDHGTELSDVHLLRETVEWFAQAFSLPPRPRREKAEEEGAMQRALGRSGALVGGWLLLVAGPLVLCHAKVGSWVRGFVGSARTSPPAHQPTSSPPPANQPTRPRSLCRWWSNLRASPGLILCGGGLVVGWCGRLGMIPPRTAATVLVLGLMALPVTNGLARSRSWPRSLILGLGYAAGLFLSLYLGIAAMSYHHWREAPVDWLSLPQFLVTAAESFPLTAVDFLTRTFFAAYSTALIPRIWLFIPVALELLWPGGMLGAFLEFAQRFKPRPHPSRPTRFLLWVSAAVIVGLALLDLTQPPLEDPDEWRKMGRMLLAFLMVPGWIFAGLLQTRLAAIWQQWGHRSGESEADG